MALDAKAGGLNIAVDSVAGVTVVHVSGEVDMSNTASIEDAITSSVTNQAHGMVLDLSGATYLDSAGVRMLYHLESRLTMRQQRLVVVVPPGAQIMRTLQAAGVIGSLFLTSSVDVAAAVANTEEQQAGPNDTIG